MMPTDTAIKPRQENALKHDPKLNIQEPKLFKVIFVNDEITTWNSLLNA